jgi:hypothetical protein
MMKMNLGLRRIEREGIAHYSLDIIGRPEAFRTSGGKAAVKL